MYDDIFFIIFFIHIATDQFFSLLFIFAQIFLQFYTLTINHILQVANFTCY